MSGVEAEAIDMKITEPIETVFEEEGPGVGAVWAMKIGADAPRSVDVRGIEAGMEEAVIGTIGAKVVIDGVEVDGQSKAMGLVDEIAEIIRAAIVVIGRVQRDAVVAPVPAAGAIGEGHEFDGGDAEVAQERELSGGGSVGSFGSEGAEVEFIENGLGPRDRREVAVNPGVGRIDDFRQAMDAVGLEAGSGIRKRALAIEQIAVTGTGADTFDEEFAEAVGVDGEVGEGRMGVAWNDKGEMGSRGPDVEADAMSLGMGAEGKGGGH